MSSCQSAEASRSTAQRNVHTSTSQALREKVAARGGAPSSEEGTAVNCTRWSSDEKIDNDEIMCTPIHVLPGRGRGPMQGRGPARPTLCTTLHAE